MKEFFKHFETSNAQEREKMAEELKEMYFNNLKEEGEAWAKFLSNRRSTNAKKSYSTAIQRLGAIQGVFQILGIDWENLEKEFHNKQEG